MLHGYFLGALTPDAAVETIFPQNKVSSSAGHTAATRALMVQAAQDGQMLDEGGVPAYIPGTHDCSATGQSSTVKLAQTSTGLALTGTTAVLSATGAVAAAALAPWTMGISAIIGLFPMIFGHHAQAVKKEQSVLCAAVPAANNYLQIIDQAVQSGQVSPNDAIGALQSLENDFESNVSSIIKGSGPADPSACNASCVMFAQLRAIVALKTSEYQDLLSGAATQVVPTRPNVTSPAGSSAPASSYASFYGSGSTVPTPTSSTGDWLPIAAIAAAAFLFLRGS